jgi:GNAT superfamily N-acetyltransferase
MPERLSIGRAISADAPAVLALTRAAYAKWVPVIAREPLPMTADYDRAIAEHIIDLGEQGGQLLALVEVIPKEGYLLIENIAVRPDQQGKGLGDQLLLHAEGLARSLGFDETQLYTNAAFTWNLAFYTKRGYQEYRRGTTIPGSTTVFMRKSIKPQD